MINAIIARIPAKDMEETELFYTEKLGFQVEAKFEGYLMLSVDGLEIHFFHKPNLHIRSNETMLYIRTKELHSWHEKAQQQAVRFADLGALEEKPWGMLEFSILDPNFTLLTFGQEI